MLYSNRCVFLLSLYHLGDPCRFVVSRRIQKNSLEWCDGTITTDWSVDAKFYLCCEDASYDGRCAVRV